MREIDTTLNWEHLEATLMAEGVKKFADPMKVLVALIGEMGGRLRAAIRRPQPAGPRT
jgi:hypothetical protein